ncbi:hypothetical protein ES705_20899 [subsurface metagenome]
MAIEDPDTYAEWYWKHSVDATNLRSKQAEQAYAPIIQQILDDSGLSEFMPDALRNLFGNLTTPTDDYFDTISTGFMNIVAHATSLVAGENLARPLKYDLNNATPTLRIEPDMAAILRQRKLMSPEIYELYASWAGYSKDEAGVFYNSRLPYPSIPDIISATRYLSGAEDVKNNVMAYYDISDKDWYVWDWLTYQKFTTGEIQSLYKMGLWEETQTDNALGRVGWMDSDKFYVRQLAYEVPNAMLMVQGGLFQGLDVPTIKDNIGKAGIHPLYADFYYDAVMTKPASEDIIAYELRRDPSLSNLHRELRKVGVHKNYHDLYKELAYQIPPVADIITMAVREAFTPAIAARFGQYEDLPSEYVTAVQKKGLSKEWAERYWAAHWTLPSAQQGFEMLHRGVIGVDDLNMLMRALDIMPFWRDKLTQIAYRPLSRVDVRRMFALGVLDVSGVRKAYTDIGYNDYNADLMTKFTIEYVKGVPKKMSTADIVTAYKKHLIESGTLRTQLSEAGIESEDIEPIVRTAQQRRDWSDREDNIKTVEYLYKQGRYTEEQTKNELRNLRLTEDYIENLVPHWTPKLQAERETMWTNAQTLSFMKSGLITIERGKQELTDLGYDEEHINVYLASVKPE